MITTSFAQRTVICIAHRLQTIIGYDRVVVMDAGRIVESGTPLDLYRANATSNGSAGGEMNSGMFRRLCERSGIGMEDIVNAGLQRGEIRDKARAGVIV